MKVKIQFDNGYIVLTSLKRHFLDLTAILRLQD